jgi:hypothetical protein
VSCEYLKPPNALGRPPRDRVLAYQTDEQLLIVSDEHREGGSGAAGSDLYLTPGISPGTA